MNRPLIVAAVTLILVLALVASLSGLSQFLGAQAPLPSQPSASEFDYELLTTYDYIIDVLLLGDIALTHTITPLGDDPLASQPPGSHLVYPPDWPLLETINVPTEYGFYRVVGDNRLRYQITHPDPQNIIGKTDTFAYWTQAADQSLTIGTITVQIGDSAVINLTTDEGYIIEATDTQDYVHAEDYRLKIYLDDLPKFLPPGENYELVDVVAASSSSGSLTIVDPATDEDDTNNDEGKYLVYIPLLGDTFLPEDEFRFRYRVAGSPNIKTATAKLDNGDGDGVSRAAEEMYGTDPHNPDTDGDLVANDSVELILDKIIRPGLGELLKTISALQGLEEINSGDQLSTSNVVPLEYTDPDTGQRQTVEVKLTSAFDLTTGVATITKQALDAAPWRIRKEVRYPDGTVESFEDGQLTSIFVDLDVLFAAPNTQSRAIVANKIAQSLLQRTNIPPQNLSAAYSQTLANWISDDYSDGAFLQLDVNTKRFFLVYDDQPGSEFGHQVIVPAKFGLASQFEGQTSFGAALVTYLPQRVIKSTGLAASNPSAQQRRKQYLVSYQGDPTTSYPPGTFVITLNKVSTIEQNWLGSKQFTNTNLFTLHRRLDSGTLTRGIHICSESLPDIPIELSYPQSYWQYVTGIKFFGPALEAATLGGVTLFEATRGLGEAALSSLPLLPHETRLEHELNALVQRLKFDMNGIRFGLLAISDLSGEALEDEVSLQSHIKAQQLVKQLSLSDDLKKTLDLQVLERRTLIALDQLGITKASFGSTEYLDILNAPITDNERAIVLMSWTGREGVEYARRAAQSEGLASFGNASVAVIYSLGESAAQTIPFILGMNSILGAANSSATTLNDWSGLADSANQARALQAAAVGIGAMKTSASSMIFAGMAGGALDHSTALLTAIQSGDTQKITESFSDVFLDLFFVAYITGDIISQQSPAHEAEILALRQKFPDLITKFEQLMPKARQVAVDSLFQKILHTREYLSTADPYNRQAAIVDALLEIKKSSAMFPGAVTRNKIKADLDIVKGKVDTYLSNQLSMAQGESFTPLRIPLDAINDSLYKPWLEAEFAQLNGVEQVMLLRRMGLFTKNGETFIPYEMLSPQFQRMQIAMQEALRLTAERTDTDFGQQAIVLNGSVADTLSIYMEAIMAGRGDLVPLDLEFARSQEISQAARYDWWEPNTSSCDILPKGTEIASFCYNDLIRFTNEGGRLPQAYQGNAADISMNANTSTQLFGFIIKAYLTGLEKNDILRQTNNAPLATLTDHGVFVQSPDLVSPYQGVKLSLEGGQRLIHLEGGEQSLNTSGDLAIPPVEFRPFIPTSVFAYRGMVELPNAKPPSTPWDTPWKFTPDALSVLRQHVNNRRMPGLQVELAEIVQRAVIPEARNRGVELNLSGGLDALLEFYKTKVFTKPTHADALLKIELAVSDLKSLASAEVKPTTGLPTTIGEAEIDMILFPEKMSVEQYVGWSKLFGISSENSLSYKIRAPLNHAMLKQFYDQVRLRHSEPISQRDAVNEMELYFNDLFELHTSQGIATDGQQLLTELHTKPLGYMRDTFKNMRAKLPPVPKQAVLKRPVSVGDAISRALAILNPNDDRPGTNRESEIILDVRQVIEFLKEYDDLLQPANNHGRERSEPSDDEIAIILNRTTDPSQALIDLMNAFPVFPDLDDNFRRHDITGDEVINQNDIIAFQKALDGHLDNQNKAVLDAYLAMDADGNLIVTKAEAGRSRDLIAAHLNNPSVAIPDKYNVNDQPGIDQGDLDIFAIVSNMSFIVR